MKLKSSERKACIYKIIIAMVISRALWNDKFLQWSRIYLIIYIIETEHYKVKDFDSIMRREGSKEDEVKQIVEIEDTWKLKSWGMK